MFADKILRSLKSDVEYEPIHLEKSKIGLIYFFILFKVYRKKISRNTPLKMLYLYLKKLISDSKMIRKLNIEGKIINNSPNKDKKFNLNLALLFITKRRA